jgi:hypothetical protein
MSNRTPMHEAIYRERWRDELVEHIKVLCMTLHHQPYALAGTIACQGCLELDGDALVPQRPWWWPW